MGFLVNSEIGLSEALSYKATLTGYLGEIVNQCELIGTEKFLFEEIGKNAQENDLPDGSSGWIGLHLYRSGTKQNGRRDYHIVIHKAYFKRISNEPFIAEVFCNKSHVATTMPDRGGAAWKVYKHVRSLLMMYGINKSVNHFLATPPIQEADIDI